MPTQKYLTMETALWLHQRVLVSAATLTLASFPVQAVMLQANEREKKVKTKKDSL